MTATPTPVRDERPVVDLGDDAIAPAAPRHLGAHRLAAASVAVAVVPVVVATARALRQGWVPIGDNALFQLRAQDVLTSHHPLVGTWTSASHSLGHSVNNPGPLLFDLLAIPAKIGGGAGVAVGIAILNIACIVAIALVAHRRGGPIAVGAAMVMCAGLAWTMGSELLFDPWQPHSLLFPFLLFLVLAWTIAAGRVGALPWAAAVATLIVQTHLSYALIVPLVSVCAVGSCAFALRRAVAAHPAARPANRRLVVRTLVVTAGVLAVLWAQPVVEQLTGEGNLATLAGGASSGDAPAVGAELGTRLVGSVLTVPPFWARKSFETTLNPFGRDQLADLRAAAMSLGALALLLAASWLRLRTRDRSVASASGLAIAAMGLSLATVFSLPRGEFGVPAHQLRLLWPVALFITFALILTALRMLGPARQTAGVAVLLGVVVLLAAASVPTYNVRAGPSADAASIPATRALLAQLDGPMGERLKTQAPLLFDVSMLQFAEPYSVPILADLDRGGIEFQLDDEGWVDQVGPSRRYPGMGANGIPRSGAARARLIELGGDASFNPPPGAELVARVVGLSDNERDELDGLRDEIAAHVREYGLSLTRRGRVASGYGAIFFAATAGAVTDPESVVANGQLPIMVRERLVVVDPGWRSRFNRYVQLQDRWTDDTVALFLVPIDVG